MTKRSWSARSPSYFKTGAVKHPATGLHAKYQALQAVTGIVLTTSSGLLALSRRGAEARSPGGRADPGADLIATFGATAFAA